MQLSRIYELVLKYGIECDPRKNKSGINSYPDSAILYGQPEKQVHKILVGIDIETPELLLADKIRHRDGLDLVISHHPEGAAYAGLYQVMQLQVDLMEQLGLDRKSSQQFLEVRQREVERRIMPANHMRSVDAARLLSLPFMCIHTPADNQVADFVLKFLQKAKPACVGDIPGILLQIPEYKQAAERLAGPKLILGDPKRPAGSIFVDMTGGTEGSKEVFKKMHKAGVRTLVSMHLSEEHLAKVRDANLNVVIAGHISSDNLGLNLLLDKIEKEEKFNCVSCSGFQRIRRSEG
jgi:putative NIF3 family GTP cyclohydrolase 1 type 2